MWSFINFWEPFYLSIYQEKMTMQEDVAMRSPVMNKMFVFSLCENRKMSESKGLNSFRLMKKSHQQQVLFRYSRQF